jgi:hypothetical protein
MSEEIDPMNSEGLFPPPSLALPVAVHSNKRGDAHDRVLRSGLRGEMEMDTESFQRRVFKKQHFQTCASSTPLLFFPTKTGTGMFEQM